MGPFALFGYVGTNMSKITGRINPTRATNRIRSSVGIKSSRPITLTILPWPVVMKNNPRITQDTYIAPPTAAVWARVPTLPCINGPYTEYKAAQKANLGNQLRGGRNLLIPPIYARSPLETLRVGRAACFTLASGWHPKGLSQDLSEQIYLYPSCKATRSRAAWERGPAAAKGARGDGRLYDPGIK
ncbi:hypothetical protein SAMD00023353_6500620 [Rosellinia necatrix]|uniref:Uncharacterized protein n=1 Tax=Rosellinia necatrix TaxID=77044 RepID=A0A1S8AAL8_ROSNE|nr:hypothetical protein SAMD00023353_6500620 [Rosellinia necatrix]